jgi:hypothetical protein
VKDGATTTFMIGEQYWNQNLATCQGRGQAAGLGLGFAWVHSIEASAFGGQPVNCNDNDPLCAKFKLNFTPPKPEADANGNMPETWPDDCEWRQLNGFRSRHSGGALFATCDSRVVFVSNNVDLKVYRAQFTVNGGKAEGTLILE